VVSDDGRGNLVASEGSELVQTAAFTNTYEASPAGSAAWVKKTHVRREWSTGASSEIAISAPKGTPMPGTTKVTVTEADKDKVVSFGGIKFDEPGTYAYTVTEARAGETVDGVAYDEEDHEVTIVVSDDGRGNLVASEGSALVQTVGFTNVYGVAETEGEVRVKKTLVGRDWATGDEFEFTISAKDGAPAPAKDKVTVTKDSADLTESFGKITFDKAGIYKYVVSEVHKGETVGGVAYDAKDRTVTIEVADDGKGREADVLAALGGLGDAVDMDDSFEVFVGVLTESAAALTPLWRTAFAGSILPVAGTGSGGGAMRL
jgi:pilin isopeptide linkage protein